MMQPNSDEKNVVDKCERALNYAGKQPRPQTEAIVSFQLNQS